MSYNLTGATVSSTYGRIVQVVHGTPDLYYDGFGNLLELGAGTASVGPAGTSGTSGFNGTSGTSGMGTSGTSGTSGLTGTSGTSGVDGTSGIDGTNGTSGLAGTSGSSGTSDLSTGIISFDYPGISLYSTTKFNVASMTGSIVHNTGTYSSNPEVNLVSYPGEIGVTASYLSTSTITYILVNSSGQLVQQNTYPTSQQKRENIYLGKIGHVDKATLSLLFNEPDIRYSGVSQLREMFTPIKLINDSIYPSSNGPNLNFNTSSGTLWGLGIGYTVNQLSPSSISIPGQSPTTFQYRTQLGGTYSSTTLVDPTRWDNGGVLTTITGAAKQATNQRIFLLQNGSIRVQYGQTVYTDLSTAISNIQTEVFTTFSNFKNNGILIGVLSVASNTSNLSDVTYARFFLVSKFGELIGAAGGVSTTTLQQAYNNSSEPEIITNSVLDGVTFRRGTNSDTDNVFAVQNGSASNTFYVRGDGNTWASSLHLTNIGLTSGATKYMVVNDSGDVFYQTTIVGGGGVTGPAGPTGAGGALGYYGSFFSTLDQLNPTASVARVWSYDSIYESNGVSIVDNSKLKFQHPGTYNIQFSTVFNKTTSNAGQVDVWFSKNGSYIGDSNTQFNIAGQSNTVASWNFIQTVNANDYVEIYWQSTDTNISLNYTGTQSNPDRPAVPSIILTAQQIMYTQLGATGANGTSGTSGTSGVTGTSGTSGTSGYDGTSGLNGAGYYAHTPYLTSVSTGSQTFNIDSPTNANDIAYRVGDRVVGREVGDTSHYFEGVVTSVGFSPNTLTVNVDISVNTTLNMNGYVFSIIGVSGTSGINGTSGTSGLTGTSGTSGTRGTSGTSGLTGTSGTSGLTGTSGTSGLTGTSGSSGLLSLTGTTDNGLITLNGTVPNATVESTLTYDGTELYIAAQSGDEGGQLRLNKSVTNTSINTGVNIDIYQNKVRIFENGSPNRGGYIDITDMQDLVGVNLAPYRYLYARRATSHQTIGSGTWQGVDVIFNSVVNSLGISFDTSTGVATLSPGTYRISVKLAWVMAGSYVIAYSVFSSTNTQLGPTTELFSNNNGTNNYSPGDLDFIYSTSTSIGVKVRIATTSAATGEQIRSDLNTSFIIQQVG